MCRGKIWSRWCRAVVYVLFSFLDDARLFLIDFDEIFASHMRCICDARRLVYGIRYDE